MTSFPSMKKLLFVLLQDPIYVSEMAEMLYKACRKQTSVSKPCIATQIKRIALAITCRLEVFDWDGRVSSVKGYLDLNTCLRFLVHNPKLDGTRVEKEASVTYTLACLWVYLGVIQSYNLTQQVWDKHWEILGGIMKIYLDSDLEEVSWVFYI